MSVMKGAKHAKRGIKRGLRGAGVQDFCVWLAWRCCNAGPVMPEYMTSNSRYSVLALKQPDNSRITSGLGLLYVA